MSISVLGIYVADLVFFGKKIFGNSVTNSDKLSKKLVFWILLISVFLTLLIGLSGMGSGMGG